MNRIVSATAAFLFLYLAMFQTVSATAGDLDPTFRGGGRLRTAIGGGSDFAGGMVRQPDGKLIVVGTSGNFTVAGGFVNATPSDRFTILRYNTDGTLDTTFGVGGKVRSLVGSAYDHASAVALSGSSIFVAGYADSSLTGTPVDFALAKYTASGTLDTTFGTGGYVLTDFGGTTDNALALAVQTDGKIVLAGEIIPATGASKIGVARYNTNGTLDTTFDGDGKITAGNPEGTQLGIRGTAVVTGRNTIYVGSVVSAWGGFLFAFNTNGSVKTQFGDNGVSGAIATHSMVLRPPADADGLESVISCGETHFQDSTLYQTLSGIDEVGASTLFSHGPVPNSNCNSVQLQYSGGFPSRIITAGSINNDLLISKYKLDGTLDTAFSGDGMASVDFSQYDSASAVLLQPDNKIVIAGTTSGGLTQIDTDFAISRLNSNGSSDTTFSSDGKRTEDIGDNLFIAARATLMQLDGKILAIGDSAIARFNSDGTFDTSFDEDGKLKVQTRLLGAAQQPDGKIVAVGGTITRFNLDGSPDLTFGGGSGIVASPAQAVAIQSDGKIVSVNGSVISRYLTNGTLDASFGTGGTSTIAFGDSVIFVSLAIQPDNKIVAAGYYSPTSGAATQFILTRLNANGTFDASFSNDAVQTTTFGTLGSRANSIAIRSGKIVAVGNVMTNATNSFNTAIAIAQYNLTDGSPDTTFDVDGKLTTSIGTYADTANAVAIQSDGKIVVAGGTSNAVAANNFLVVRYNTNGSLDTLSTSDRTFSTRGNFSDSRLPIVPRSQLPVELDPLWGSGGKVEINFGGNDQAYAIAIDSAGRAVAVGQADGLFGLIRLQSDTAAANVNISGRTLTSVGRGVRNAVVTITDENGLARNTLTGPNGTYMFANVPTGHTYTANVLSRRFTFTPRVVQPTDNVSGFDFVSIQ